MGNKMGKQQNTHNNTHMRAVWINKAKNVDNALHDKLHRYRNWRIIYGNKNLYTISNTIKTRTMYGKVNMKKGSLKVNNSYEGETIEQKIERILNNNEPISDGAPLVYTDRKDGVQPDYDIRTDRWDHAIEAMDKVSKAKIAKREEQAKAREEKKAEDAKIISMKKDGNKGETGGQSIHGGE